MRLLLVTSRHPLPAWRGNQARTVQWAEALAEHDLTVLCPAGGAAAGVGTARLETVAGRSGAVAGVVRAVVRGAPFQEGLYDRPAARRRLTALLADEPPFDLVVVQLVRCAWAAEVVAALRPGTPLLYDAVDSMALHFARAAEASTGPRRWLAAAESERCRRREAWLAGRSRVVAAVSERDLAAIGGGGRRFVVPVAGREPVATGAGEKAPSPTVVVTGNLGYRPTVDGALRFARQAWPLVRRAVPAARLVLAGARPARRLRGLVGRDGIEVHGDVASLDPFLATAAVALAPMAQGSGVPMKVLEAWAAGVPVVAHPWAAEGLGRYASACVVPGEDTPEAWAREVVALLTGPGRAADLARRGLAAWQAGFRPERVAEAVRAAVVAAAG